MARRRGRRVRPDGRAAAARDRRRDQRRARPSHDVLVPGRGRRDVRALARSRSKRGARLGARAGRRSRWPSRASTTGGTPPARSPPSSSRRRSRAKRRRCSPSSAARDGASSSWASRAGSRSTTTTRTIRARWTRRSRQRARPRPGRVIAAFQPHLYSRTRHLAREFAGALAGADAVCVTEIYAAREEPVEGVSGKLVVDALAEVRPGAAVGWTPASRMRSLSAARAEPGDLARDDRRRRHRPSLRVGWSRCWHEDRGGRRAPPADHDRDRGPCARLRTARDRGGAGGGALLGSRTGSSRRTRRARV